MRGPAVNRFYFALNIAWYTMNSLYLGEQAPTLARSGEHFWLLNQILQRASYKRQPWLNLPSFRC